MPCDSSFPVPPLVRKKCRTNNQQRPSAHQSRLSITGLPFTALHSFLALSEIGALMCTKSKVPSECLIDEWIGSRLTGAISQMELTGVLLFAGLTEVGQFTKAICLVDTMGGWEEIKHCLFFAQQLG